MDTKKLRQKILDLAIHGKLVPQDPNDEPASVLLERIRAEKERLVKEGKIKRSKKSASDDEIEAPFEIPESWEWVRLDDIAILINGDRGVNYPNKNEYVSNGIAWINAGHITNGGYLSEANMNYISQEKYDLLGSGKIQSGDLVFCLRGTIGKVARVEPYSQGAIASSLVIIRVYLPFIRDYLFCVLKSDYAKIQLNNFDNGTAQPNLAAKDVEKYFIPLPPLSEQKRITNAVERWFTLIDELESNEGDLLKAIDKAKSKILDLAIHGKLVPQDPNDEPAIDLLKRINPKFEPCDEVPWELPNNWCWTTLGNISNYGKCMHVEAKDIPNDSWVLELEDLEKDTAKLLQRVTCTEREIKGVRSVFRKGDILFSKLRTYLNKVLVAPEDGYCSTEIVPISLCDSLSSHYINHVLRSKYFVEYTTSCGYGVKMPRLSTTDARKGLIPLPPYQEQLRIVAKIEELFGVLDSIKESLEA